MPQLQYDYDYYERKKTGSTMKNSRSNSRSTAVPEDIWKNHRASIRAALDSDDEVYVRRAPAKPVVKAPTTKQEVKSKQTPKKQAKKKVKKPKKMSLKKAEVMVSPKVKVQVEKKNNVFRNVMVSLCSFSILFLICYRSSVINESFKSVNQMKADLENVKTMNAQIESEIQTQTDLSNIETYAKYQLGMQKPKESQIKKVIIEKTDKIATPMVEEKEEEISFWKKLMNDIRHIID